MLIALICGGLFSAPGLEAVRGLSLDVLTALRWHVFGTRYDPAAAPAVVVAIDEDTFRTPPFAGSPSLTWTREIGRVLTAVIDGGAKVVGFDIIFPTSIEQSEIPFGEDRVGARMRGFDRDFLRALANAARQGKVVLGEVQHRDEPILPSPGQRIAVGHQRNIRSLNAYADPDDVVRRLPLTLSTDGKPVPSMAVELAARALGTEPREGQDGTMELAGYRIPGRIANTLTLNFGGGSDDILTYSFADLRACVENNDTEFFRRNFDGKVVLFGTLLDIEDRKVTSKRFATGLEAARAPRCALPMPSTGAKFTSNTIAGVYIHATGVNDLIRADAVTELGRFAAWAIITAVAVAAAVATLMLAPWTAILASLGIIVLYAAGATWVFRQSLALPLVEPALAAILALAATVGYRFVIADREDRFLRRSFGLYLAPAVIEKMLASNKAPALGGEMRNVTIFFSDIAGFSSISEKMSPSALVMLMNEYLSAMTEIIEECGGYIDKYIGDSIVAIFGAPVDDPDHARNAVRAALLCRTKLEELNRTAAAFQGHKLGHRIGLNTGDALVGNIGSHRRFNYTVMSDAVNLAARLEGANKFFGTSIMVAETTVALTGSNFSWRELDAIRVKGRSQPVRIYEPLAEAGRESHEQETWAARYAQGLAAWRQRDFAVAVTCFESVAEDDPPSAKFLSRARTMVESPPGPDWQPICTLESK